MKVVFLGVGEACDETLPNTSLWVAAKVDGVKISMLFDCGFTVPSVYWQMTSDAEELDVIWISHFHGDHFFGLPALLLRMYEMGRKKPLTIVGQADVEKIVQLAMELAYPNFTNKLTYPLEFIPVDTGQVIEVGGLQWKFAENGHTQRSLAVRVNDCRNSVFYSGDGPPTNSTQALAEGCDLVIHEAFRLRRPTPGHGTIHQCIDLARRASVPYLALVHLQRDERKERSQEILRLINDVEDIHILLPEPGDELELGV